MRGIKRRISEMNKISSLLLKHGTQTACIVMAAALAAQIFNINSGNYSIRMSLAVTAAAESGAAIFAITVIGGLLFDYIYKKYNAEK